MAASVDSVDMVEKILDAYKASGKSGIDKVLRGGLSIDVVDSLGRSALHYAVIQDNPDLVESLLKSRANPNIRIKKAGDGRTPLHHLGMSSVQSKNIAEQLLQAKADINAFSDARETPLHRAVLFSSEDTVRYLLKSNANPSIKTKDGKTPHDCTYDPDMRALLKMYI